jgi:hypothetical protein
MHSAASAAQYPEQVSKGKQCESQNRTDEIKIVSGTVALSPLHAREQVISFGNVRKHDHEEGYCTGELRKRPHGPVLCESHD